MTNSDVYLKATMQLIARQTFAPERLVDIVSSQKNAKTLRTFNLCDGTRTQTEVAKASSTDPGLLSRTIGRWIDEGVIVRVNENGSEKPVHVYPIPEKLIPKVERAKNG
jgi:hypothetical protein